MFAYLSSLSPEDSFNGSYYVLRKKGVVGKLDFFILGVEDREVFSVSRDIGKMLFPALDVKPTKSVRRYSFFHASWENSRYRVRKIVSHSGDFVRFKVLSGIDWDDYLALKR